MKKQIISKAYNSILINPQSSAVCSIAPPRSAFFEPKRAQVACLSAEDPSRTMDLKIGAVTIGGMPQLAINTLVPDETSLGIRPEDLHHEHLNWSIFSTAGLCRELQMSMYNPNRDQVAVFVCLDGLDVHDLDDDVDIRSMDRYELEILAEESLTQNEISGQSKMSGIEVELDPFSHGVIQLMPSVTPFFEPSRIQLHGRRADSDDRVPFAVINAYCNDRFLYGGQDIVERILSGSRTGNLKMLMSILGNFGFSGRLRQEIEEFAKNNSQQELCGILSNHITNGPNGWGDISWWPTISTFSLGQEAGLIVHNPWPFKIWTSATIAGTLQSSRTVPGNISTIRQGPPTETIPKTAKIYGADGLKSVTLPTTAPAPPEDLISFIENNFANLDRWQKENLTLGRAMENGYQKIASMKCCELMGGSVSAEDIAAYCMRIMHYDNEREDCDSYRVMIDVENFRLANCIYVDFASLLAESTMERFRSRDENFK